MSYHLNNFLRTVWWIECVLLLSLAPQGVALASIHFMCLCFYLQQSKTAVGPQSTDDNSLSRVSLEEQDVQWYIMRINLQTFLLVLKHLRTPCGWKEQMPLILWG